MSIAGYTNLDNPFGDTRLEEPFIWHKRELKRQAMGLDSASHASQVDRRFQIEKRLLEIEKIKRRRVPVSYTHLTLPTIA